MRLPSDVVLHMKSRHPEVTEQDIALVPEVLSRLNATTAVRTSTRQFGLAYVGVAEVDGKSYGISFSVAKNGVLYLNTFFRDSPEKLRAWLEQKKEAFKGRADRAEARTRDSRVTHDKPLEKSLKQQLQAVKDSDGLFQRAYHGTPHRFDQFTLDHIGSGEGAQVHGWGLYFAADKNVSEEYRKRLGVMFQ